ncbi:hypothetical protein EBX31_14745, partial [bacterium]|nr:hypothetical protein [bacterium]
MARAAPGLDIISFRERYLMSVRTPGCYLQVAAVVLTVLAQGLQAQQGWLKPFSEARYEPYRT